MDTSDFTAAIVDVTDEVNQTVHPWKECEDIIENTRNMCSDFMWMHISVAITIIFTAARDLKYGEFHGAVATYMSRHFPANHVPHLTLEQFVKLMESYPGLFGFWTDGTVGFLHGHMFSYFRVGHYDWDDIDRSNQVIAEACWMQIQLYRYLDEVVEQGESQFSFLAYAEQNIAQHRAKARREGLAWNPSMKFWNAVGEEITIP